MKHTYTKRTSILTLLTFFTLALGSQWTFGQITNGDFSSAWTGDASGDWKVAAAKNMDIYHTSTPNQGTIPANVTNQAAEVFIASAAINRNIWQNNTLSNGKTYKLTFKVYTTESGQTGGSDATSSTKGIGAVYKVGSTWKAIGTTGSEIKAFTADQWNNYSYTFTMPEDATIVGLKFRRITGVFYIDDVTLTEIPTITITSTDITSGSTTSTDPINLTFTTSASTTSFDSSDITVSDGTLSGFSGSGTSYSANFTAGTDGTFNINVAAGAFEVNDVDNLASNTFSYTYTANASLTYGTATYASEKCNDEDSRSTITLPFSNATAGDTYSVTVTPNDQGIILSTSSFTGSTSGNIVLTNAPQGEIIEVTMNNGNAFPSGDLSAPTCSSNIYKGTGGKWSVASDWTESRVPNENDDVIVYGETMWNNGEKNGTKTNGESIDFDEDGEVRNITFKIRANIKKGGSLKCNDITFENGYNQLSDNNGNGSNGQFPSLIYTGTLSFSDATNGNLGYIKRVADTNNDLISSPFDEESFSNFYTGDVTEDVMSKEGVDQSKTGIAPYSNSEKGYEEWDKADASKFELGRGYAIGVTHNGSNKQIRFNLNYDGSAPSNLASPTLNTVVSLVRTAADKPWNLIGNPYIAYYDLAMFLSDNAGAIDDNYEAIYGYNNGTFDTYNSSNSSTRHIAPGTAFFVAAATNSSEITFKPVNRKTYTESAALSGGTGDDFNSARANTSVERFDLVISDGDKKFKTNFYFDNNVTAGLDRGYDAGSFNAKSQNLAIYSVLADNSSELDLSIQALPLDKLENQKVKLGVNAKAGNNYSISLENNSFENQSIFITDHETNQVFDLTKGAYNFTVNSDLEGTERFEISFQSEALSQQESLLNQLQVVTQNHTITVIGNIESNTSLKVYDLQGRDIAQKAVSNNNRVLRLDSQNTGVYVVSISNTNGQRTQKVILK